MRSSWRVLVALGLVLVVVVWLAGDPAPDDGEPLAPDATGPSGAKAAVILLEELGAEVDVEGVAGPGPGTDAALLLEDRLGDERREAVLDWVGQGGTLLVADPRSPLAPPVAGPLGGVLGLEEAELERGDCTIEGIDDVERLEPAAGVRYDATGGARCFADEDGAFVVEQVVGSGRVVAVGAPAPFTNDALDDADHAVLLADVLVPERSGRVAFLAPGATAVPGDGDESLIALVPDRVVLMLVQLALAFLVYVLFRARRAGRPVLEPSPTTLAGSELVEAVGRLRQQQHDPERAAGVLRDDLRRLLARRLGLRPDAPVDEVVAAAERTGADPDRLRRALAGGPVADGEALTELARTIDVTRREVLHEQH